MASYGKFQNPYRKYAGHSNVFKAPKCMTKEKERPSTWEDTLIDWNTFYRRNIHRFIQHYFQVKLFWYQILWIYFMSINDLFCAICSRASAKSWLIGLYALAYGTLYPNSQIVISAATIKQARIIIDKIRSFQNDYPNIAREIKEFKDSQNRIEVLLHSGTSIKVVSATDSGRGNRATLVIDEEFRIMKKEALDQIVRPFLIPRQPPYIQDAKYRHLIEEPKEILISSAYFKSEWWYQETANIIKLMMVGKKAGFIAMDYLTAIKHGIKTNSQIEKERQTMDSISFEQEYMNIPFGESSNAFFKLNLFNKTHSIKKAFYPQKIDNFNLKSNPYNIKKVDGEKRIISCDIATRQGKGNDATVIMCVRLLPTNRGYERNVVYLETHNGENTIVQSQRIKQVFYDFEADYLVLDLQNAGVTIYDNLGKVTKDDERNVEYPAWTVMNAYGVDEKVQKELAERTISLNAVPLIFPVSASAKLNNDAAFSLRNKIEIGMFEFLLEENVAEEYLLKTNKEFVKKSDDIYSKLWFLHPYIQTSELIIEMISLEMSINSGLVKLSEPKGGRKDRYSALCYANILADRMDYDIIKEDDDGDLMDFIKMANTPNRSQSNNIFRFR